MRPTLVLALLAGCGGLYRHPPTSAPDEPMALGGVNTPFDDYNASKPPHWQSMVYSTSRGSDGKDLDVYEVEIRWDATPTALRAPVPLEPSLMSPANERGPLVLPSPMLGDTRWGNSAIVFASDREGGRGGFDLYWSLLGSARELRPLHHLNSPANDVYLTLQHVTGAALFASDRGGGGYDIYEASWAADLIDAPIARLVRVDALSTDADDTAPYVDPERRLVVFASNRAGSLGGYDLWCSTFQRDGWQAPRPLPFNTAADEFRPSLLVIGDARFLIFSSNRPGGAGGFDLYTVRFDGC